MNGFETLANEEDDEPSQRITVEKENKPQGKAATIKMRGGSVPLKQLALNKNVRLSKDKPQEKIQRFFVDVPRQRTLPYFSHASGHHQ